MNANCQEQKIFSISKRESTLIIKKSIYTPILALFVSLFLVDSSFGQTFDERFEDWPVDLKIGGTIIACASETLPERALEFVVSKGASTTVLVCFEKATVTADELDKAFEESSSLKRINIGVKEEAVGETTLKQVESADVVWVVASKTLSKQQSQSLSQIMTASGRAVQNGGKLIVCGPIIERLGRFRSDQQFGLTARVKASNLIPDSIIESNFNDATDRNELLGQLAANPRCVGIGIKDKTCIVLRGRKIFALGEGTASFFLMANEDKPIRVQHLRQMKSRRANPYETFVDLTAWRRDAIERTLNAFPPAEPPTPFLENGTLFIVGGGGIPDGMMEQMVELAGGKDARMVYVPCSESDEVDGPHRIVETWKKMGVASATCVHTKDRNQANSDEEFLEPLKEATGIWFGGGRQWNFSDSYYGTKAHQLMKDVLARGGVVGGSSAGASIQARYMCRANPVANFDIMAPGYERGLGFISGIAIDQHFSQRDRQKDMTQLANCYPQLLGVGIDETTALIVQKSEAKVIGKGKVHFYDRREPVVPGEDDFLAFGKGTVYDLAKRKVVENDPIEDKNNRRRP